MNIYLTTEPTDHGIEHSANVTMLELLMVKLEQQDGWAVVSGSTDADIAIMLASRLHGTGFEAYHQVTNDWDKYIASHRLAAELQTQVQRYQLVYKRSAKPGVAGCGCPHPSAQWLNRMQMPAVVCEYYLNGKFDIERLKAQVNAYRKAIEEFMKGV